jgi:hypothetical protein
VHLNTRVILTLLLPSSALIHFSLISLSLPLSHSLLLRREVELETVLPPGILPRSSLTALSLCPSLIFGRRAHCTPYVSTSSKTNPISISPTASYEMSQLNIKESTPVSVGTGPVRSTIRRARAQTVPLYARVSQDERVWNSSYQLARPRSPPPAPVVLSSSPSPTPPDTSIRYHIAGAAKKTPSYAGRYQAGHEETPTWEEKIQSRHPNTGGHRGHGGHRGG